MSLLMDILAGRDRATILLANQNEQCLSQENDSVMKGNKMDDFYFRSFDKGQIMPTVLPVPSREYISIFNLSKICDVCTSCQRKKDIMIYEQKTQVRIITRGP